MQNKIQCIPRYAPESPDGAGLGFAEKVKVHIVAPPRAVGLPWPAVCVAPTRPRQRRHLAGPPCARQRRASTGSAPRSPGRRARAGARTSTALATEPWRGIADGMRCTRPATVTPTPCRPALSRLRRVHTGCALCRLAGDRGPTPTLRSCVRRVQSDTARGLRGNRQYVYTVCIAHHWRDRRDHGYTQGGYHIAQRPADGK